MDDVAARRDALRQAATAPEADPRTLLEAALTELDGTVDALEKAAIDSTAARSPGGTPDSLRAERRLLHAAFQQAPAALLLLTPDGSVRRASNEAAALFGAPPGYATGKPLTAFVDLPQRAAVRTLLAAVARTGEPRQGAFRMLTPGGLTDVSLAVTALELPGGPLVLAASLTPGDPGRPASPARSGESSGDGHRVASMARRLDMVTAVTRLLLDNAMFSEGVTLQRCARLLAARFADWVIVDLARDEGLRRQVAAGPRGTGTDQLAHIVRDVAPGPDTLPGRVHATGKSVLLAHADDPAALGTATDGTPLLMTLRSASLLVVPIVGEAGGYGTLTLLRHASSDHFTVADLALAEDLCGHLASTLRADKMFRRRTETARALRASLLPGTLPEVPGLELAASCTGATRWREISADFYDAFRTPSGWAVAIGDVSGTGPEAAAMTAAARHVIRAFAHVHSDPADVLAAASQVLRSGGYGERFVTAALAFIQVTLDGGCRVELATAGHPGPALVRAGGRLEMLPGDGLPLGLFPSGSPPEGRPFRMDLELDAGDLLFFYTNGVSQARGEDPELFGDRLADALAAASDRSAADVVRVLSDQLADFCQGEFRDDVAMLAMRVR